MKRVSIGFTVLLLFFFAGCSQKQATSKRTSTTKSTMIVWKTPTVKYADMGFISDSGDLISAEIYGVGSALMRLKIAREHICMSQFHCMSKRQFNQKILSPHYPTELLSHIFRSQQIFDAVGVERREGGFTQSVQKAGAYDIFYSVTQEETIFEDKLNNIRIKIKKID